MAAAKPLATLSVDLDNLWSYQKVKGDPGWREYGSYFDICVPRLLNHLNRKEIRTTIFIVGQDAEIPGNRKWLRRLAEEGHECGNHSFHHEPWMTARSGKEIEKELWRSHEAIAEAAGKAPLGFRGPGFTISVDLLEAVAKMDYAFDASLLPSVIGPLARFYYFVKAGRISQEVKEQRKTLFGSISNGFLPIKPFYWKLAKSTLLEIPVTTIPLVRLPFHLSYLVWLSSFSRSLALNYFKSGLALCKAFKVSPSILLHPLDFLGKEDVASLSFFPGMDLPRDFKIEVAEQMLSCLDAGFKIVPMSVFASSLKNEKLPERVCA